MLEARRLTKRYPGVVAVDDVSFTVQPGEVLGYLGPNGSGKSTTVGMLTGLLEPTLGHVYFEGQDIRRCLIEYKRRLGYVPEVPYLYQYLTGREYLQLVARLRGFHADQKIDDMLALWSMQAARHSPIGSYSKGMRQKILIAAALLHNPDVLIFDEPLSGLDVTSALIFRRLITELALAGKIILYSSHVLEVVEKLCSRVMILDRGRVAAHDSVLNLRDVMQKASLEDVFSELVLDEDTGATACGIVDLMRA